jgi:hypothetical protein
MAYRNFLLSLLSVFLLFVLLATTIEAHGLKGAAVPEETASENMDSEHRQLFADQLQPIIDTITAIITLGGLIQQLLALLGIGS